MSHDQIKADARARMAQTGEPYSLARRTVMEERKQATQQIGVAGTAANAVHPGRASEGETAPAAIAGSMQADIMDTTRLSALMRSLSVVDPEILNRLNRITEQASKAAEMSQRYSVIRREMERASRLDEQMRSLSVVDPEILNRLNRITEQASKANRMIRLMSWV